MSATAGRCCAPTKSSAKNITAVFLCFYSKRRLDHFYTNVRFLALETPEVPCVFVKVFMCMYSRCLMFFSVYKCKNNERHVCCNSLMVQQRFLCINARVIIYMCIICMYLLLYVLLCTGSVKDSHTFNKFTKTHDCIKPYHTGTSVLMC